MPYFIQVRMRANCDAEISGAVGGFGATGVSGSGTAGEVIHSTCGLRARLVG